MNQTKGKMDAVWAITQRLRGDFQQEDYVQVLLAFFLFARTAKDLETLTADDSGISDRVLKRCSKFSPAVRNILEDLRFERHVSLLARSNALSALFNDLVKVGVSSNGISDDEMALLLDELFELNADSAGKRGGEYSIPADVSKLVARLLVGCDEDQVTGDSSLSVFDPTCGAGGCLSTLSRELETRYPSSGVVVHGQEISLAAVAMCRARLALSGISRSIVEHGDCLAADGFAELKARYLVSCPPFGLDGTLLFLLHLISKMQPASEGGSRAAFISSQSALFAGPAASGESEIRKWIIEQDLLEAVVALPPQLFHSTGIPTYLWILTNNKTAHRAGKVQIVNAKEYFERVTRFRVGLSAEGADALIELYQSIDDHPDSQFLNNDDFGFQSVLVSAPGTDSSEAGSDSSPAEPTPFRRTFEVPLHSDPLLCLEKQAVRRYDNPKIEKVEVGYAIKPIQHLGFGLQRQLEALRREYRGCRLYRLEEVCTELRSRPLRPKKDEGTAAKSSLAQNKALQGVHIQVDEDVLLPDYLAMFLATELGSKLLDAVRVGATVSRVGAKELGHIEVPVPPLTQQQELLATKANLDQLTGLLAQVDAELAANPVNIAQVQEVLTPILRVLGKVTKADEIRDLIRAGESKRVEFKETYSLDVRKQSKEEYIEEAALKNIVAFLNTEGGDLLIGVTDDGEIRGVEAELEKLYKGSADALLKQLKNRTKDRIGEEYYPLFEKLIVEVDGRQVLWVRCKPSDSPVYLDEKSFFVRTNPATDKLEGRKAHDYIQRRFYSGDA